MLHGKLYTAGGFDGSSRLSSVECFDTATNTWEAVAPMSMARCGAAAGVLDGKLYVVGGKADGNMSGNVAE